MFRSKRTVPSIAVAMLVLTGCGDSGESGSEAMGGAGGTGSDGRGGTGGTGNAAGASALDGVGGAGGETALPGVDSGGDLRAAIESFCLGQYECRQTLSMERCIDDQQASYAVKYASGECAEALASYFDCITSLGCGFEVTCEWDVSFDALYTACDWFDG